jgi:ribosomal protein L10
LFRNLILSFSLQYSRYKEVRDALDIDIAEMQKNALDLKKVSAEHYVPTKDYVSVGLLSNACLKMEQIADILDATSDKL